MLSFVLYEGPYWVERNKGEPKFCILTHPDGNKMRIQKKSMTPVEKLWNGREVTERNWFIGEYRA